MRSTIFTNHSPRLDLHGEVPEMIELLINDFINYNIVLKNEYIAIVHGIGSGIIKNKTHEILEKNLKVVDFKLNAWNIGETIVRLDIK